MAVAELRYRVEGMDCGGCAAKIDAAVRRLPGVSDVAVSATAGSLVVRHAGDPTLADAVERKVIALGYGVAADTPAAPAPAPAERPWWRMGKAMLTAASGAALVLAFVLGHLVPSIESWAYVAAMAVGLVPIARRAIMGVVEGAPFTIETLMTIAAIGAVVIGAGEEAAAVVFLFLVGELLEGVAAGRARASIRALTALVPKTAWRETAGALAEVPADSLAVGDVILVRPGDRVPADGVVLSGEGGVDEAPVTGESVPVRKAPGDGAYAGTIAVDGALRLRVTAAASDNTIARVVRLVEEAQEAKAPTERLIDRFSRWYTPAVLAVGALVAVAPPLLFGGSWPEWIYKGLAILLIGCPCALVISTPAAIAAALSAGARAGLLIKGGAVLENLGGITVAAFDKTGTLTAGAPRVTDIVAAGLAEGEVLARAAALESGSSHPLAKAILERAAADGVAVQPATGVVAVPGRGLTGTARGADLFLGAPRAAAERAPLSEAFERRLAGLAAEGKSVAVLVSDGTVAGAIAMRDEPRPDAAPGLARLQALGVGAVMLTGDNRAAADAVAGALGIEAHAELMPADKLRIVERLQREGQRVAKVGDGINDAPALAAARVGVAMGGGTDVALETADAAILHGRVGDLARMVALARRTTRNIRQNITIALGLKAVFLVTTVVGLTGLWPAILADTGATVLVTLNALRLLKPPAA